MFIVMHCGGMPFNGATIKERSLGGSETAAYYVAKNLARMGHHVRLFTASPEEGEWDGVGYVYAGEISKEAPLGNRFHFYAMSTPMDALIIQRAPFAFGFPWAANVNILWLHDLALKAHQDTFKANAYPVDRFLAVSNFHKGQIAETYGLKPENIAVTENGIDPERFKNEALGLRGSDTQIIYVSRPERGLVNLVGTDGIMERLAKKGSPVKLSVCGYDNTTREMAELYAFLNRRIEALPNCENIGHLTQAELAQRLKETDAWVYPTAFEETSCIAAMETMAAGIKAITTDAGALPETLEGYHAWDVIPNIEGEEPVNIEAFVEAIEALKPGANHKPMIRYTWDKTAQTIVDVIDESYAKGKSDNAIMSHLLRNSDILALKEFKSSGKADAITEGIVEEFHECYTFSEEETFNDHYDRYYRYEKDRGVEYGPENLDGNSRFEAVSRMIGKLDPPPKMVLDYGCAHGHYTINLAKRFPRMQFFGIDLASLNIEAALKWAKDDGVKNIGFSTVDLDTSGKFDVIIAAEVLEHVNSPQELSDELAEKLRPKGLMIITTPYGPWEAQGFKKQWPWRAHLHHLERADLDDIWGHNPGFRVVTVPAGHTKQGEGIGSYITTYSKPEEKAHRVDHKRKIKRLKPRQTLSVCMIVKDAEATLRKALDSICEIIDELIIGIDDTTTDRTEGIIAQFKSDNPQIHSVITFPIESPLKTGFSFARNRTLDRACGDWIFWLDADEIVIHPEILPRALHNGPYDGYALKQHHFAGEPAAVLKVDLPCKVFRNHLGIKFFGLVHEHPEVELNEGVGHALVLSEIEIIHVGYETEDIRRARFERNLPLIKRDRELHPSRFVGRYLWVRDLAQLNSYEAEATGVISEVMKERSKEGCELWAELMVDGDLRMIREGFEYYSKLAMGLGGGFDARVDILAAPSLNGRKPTPIEGHFLNQDHFQILVDRLIKNNLEFLGQKY